ncbi:MAG: hypothetical protein WCL00_14940 [Bacteroidota bacterium]
MRKFLYIFAALLLFIGTIGPSLNMHFCSGRFVSYSFFYTAKKCCEASCNSCKNVSVSYKIKGTYFKQAIVIDGPVISKYDLLFTEIIHPFKIQDIDGPVELTNPPPGHNPPNILFFRALRI